MWLDFQESKLTSRKLGVKLEDRRLIESGQADNRVGKPSEGEINR